MYRLLTIVYLMYCFAPIFVYRRLPRNAGKPAVGKTADASTEVVHPGLSLHAPSSTMIHGASMVVLQSTSLSAIWLVQQPACQRGTGGKCFICQTSLNWGPFSIKSSVQVTRAVVGVTPRYFLASHFRSYSPPKNRRRLVT